MPWFTRKNNVAPKGSVEAQEAKVDGLDDPNVATDQVSKELEQQKSPKSDNNNNNNNANDEEEQEQQHQKRYTKFVADPSQKGKEIPGREKFKLKDERRGKQFVEYVVGDTQKEEVKGITQTWLQYFNDKHINGVLYNAIQSLLHLLELPENPFVFLVNQLRISELFYGITHAVEEDSKFQYQTIGEEDAITRITNIIGYDNIWGVKQILQVLDPENLTNFLKQLNFYDWILAGGESSQGGFQVRYVNALVGATIFKGALLPYVPRCVHINHDYVVTGPKFEKAVALLANQIIVELGFIEQLSSALLVGVAIEKASYTRMGGAPSVKKASAEDFKVWTFGKIKSSRTSFISAVKAATVASSKIVVDFFVELPALEDLIPRDQDHGGDFDDRDDFSRRGGHEGDDFVDHTNSSQPSRLRATPGRMVRIKKLFSLHFIQTDKEGNELPSGSVNVRSFTAFPYSSLCLGIFQQRADAMFYANLFQTPEGDCWTMESRDKYASFRSYLKGLLIREYISGNLIKSVEHLTCLAAMAGRYTVMDDICRLLRSPAGQLHGLVCWNHVMCQLLEAVRDVAINGVGTTSGGHNTTTTSGGGGLDDGRGRTRAFHSHPMTELIVQEFRTYREQLIGVVMASNSSEVVAMRRLIRHELYDMSDNTSRRLIVDEDETIRRLEHVNFICEALELTIARDVVAVLTDDYFHKFHESGDTIVNLIEEVVSQVLESSNVLFKQNLDKKLEESDSKRKKKKGRGILFRKSKESENYASENNQNQSALDTGAEQSMDFFLEVAQQSLEAFANEANATERARENVRVISVPNAIKAAKKKRNVPGEIAREAVLLEYVTETRLDAVIHSTIREIFTNGKLFPNPFPLIVDRLRAEVMRHEIWRETDDSLQQQLVHGRSRIKLVSARNFLYKTIKAEIYGSHSALRCVHGQTIIMVLEILAHSGIISPKEGPNQKKVIDKEHILEDHQAEEEFREYQHRRRLGASMNTTVCTSIGGAVMLYSRLHNHSTVPLEILRTHPSITLFETHVYEGPKAQTALEVYADYMISQLLHINDKTANNLVISLATGEHAMRVINEDSSFDGGWTPVHHRRDLAHNNDDSDDDEDERSTAHEYSYHAKYTHGELLHAQKIRREKALCKQEIIRATKANEPIVLSIAMLVEVTEGDQFYVIVNKHLSLHYIQSPGGTITNYCPQFLKFEPLYQSVWNDFDQAMAYLHVVCPTSDETVGGHHGHLQDPSKPPSLPYRAYTDSLRTRIAHAFAKGDYIFAYRALLRLVLLEKEHGAILPDLMRMLKKETIPMQLNLLTDSCSVFQCLLEERQRSEASKRKIKSKILKKLYLDYRVQVENIMARQDCVFFPGTRNAIHTLLVKIGNAIDTNRAGNTTQHIEFIEELHAFLECIRVSSASAVHRNNPHIDMLFHHFVKSHEPSMVLDIL